jgi:DmsE family decaheme c-type cytochrome
MRALPWTLIVACLIGGSVPVAFAEEESECAMCHDEVVATFRRTAHATASGWHLSTACQTCHGPGEAHIEAGGDASQIIRPQLLPRRESSDGCLTCHGRKEGHFSARQAIHRLDDVGCIDCHNPHLTTESMLVHSGPELCATCHGSIAAEFELPRAHPLGEGEPGCAGCHDPHATVSSRVRPNAGCEGCHFEKAGPYLYAHDVGLVDGCTSCHRVHGSTERHLLRSDSQVNLCYECHSASHTPGWHSAPRYLNQKCTACHSAIHGSNTSQFFLEE